MGERRPVERSEDRRELLLASGLNGIDAVEVLDGDAPAGTPRQRTLVVELFRPVPPGLAAASVRVEGGVRVRNVGVAWAFSATDLETPGAVPPELVPEPERAALAAWLAGRFPAAADRARVLVVRTGRGAHDWEGDLSTYTLRLVASPTDASPPAGFDPLFSAIPFRFKVECPRDQDCLGAERCPPEPVPAPRIDYLAKDYATFRRLLLDRLAVTMPASGERNPADVMVMLVEALAHAGDHLSYFQDAVATEAYLATARRRSSVRRHARLLDYRMHDGCNARAWVAFESGLPDGVVLPAGTALCTRQPTEAPTVDAVEPGTEVFRTLHDLTLRQVHGRISFHTWGSWRWFLPEGATSAALDATAAPLALAPGDVLILEEVLGPEGTPASADPRRRQAVRLVEVAAPRRDPLTAADVVEVRWDPADALRFPLCVRAIVGERKTADLSVARGNVVLADAGRWVEDEILPAPWADHLPYRPALREGGIVCRVPWSARQASAPASRALHQDPREAVAAVEVVSWPEAGTPGTPGERWTVRRDLLASGPLDPELVVEQEADGTARLRFGDGRHGKRLPPRPRLVARYRVGNGPGGNVGAEAIAHAIEDGRADLTTLRRVRNPLPAAGGTDPERLEEVRQHAPQAFRTQERAVTEADYEAAARLVPGVHQAVATRRWTGSWYTVFLSVDRAGGAPVDDGFAAAIRDALERRRLVGEDVEVGGPVHVPLEIVMEVCVAPGYFRSDVRRALADVFASTARADGRPGFFHPDRFTFGQPVHLSQVVAAAMAVPGVTWVDLSEPARGHRFRRFGRPAAGEVRQGFIPMGRLEIARADSAPDLPENGRVDFLLEGGL